MKNINIGINEQIITGRKYRRLIDKAAKLWQRISWWTKASDVEFDDGKTAEQKVGNINGITSDFNCEDEQIAASATLTHKINEDLGGCRFGYDEDGNPGFIITDEDGADAVRPFSGKSIIEIMHSGKEGGSCESVYIAPSNGVIIAHIGQQPSNLDTPSIYFKINDVDYIKRKGKAASSGVTSNGKKVTRQTINFPINKNDVLYYKINDVWSSSVIFVGGGIADPNYQLTDLP